MNTERCIRRVVFTIILSMILFMSFSVDLIHAASNFIIISYIILAVRTPCCTALLKVTSDIKSFLQVVQI